MDATQNQAKAVVLGGKTGMLGQSLTHVLQQAGWDVAPAGREDVDVLSCDDLARYLDATEPQAVFNAVAYTKVDQAEDEPDQAFLLNKTLPANLGRLALARGIRLVHYSTDFVFDGDQSAPYTLSDEPNPTSVYGQSKLAGENSLLQVGMRDLHIIRTAWLFGPGGKNFVQTILNLARNRNQLNVVHDQIGSPTYTLDLARYSLKLVETGSRGIYHVVNSGQASWCELAAEAVNLAGYDCLINAIPSSEYPQKAKRPAFSALSTAKYAKLTGDAPRSWAKALREYVFKDYCAEPDAGCPCVD